MQDPNSTSVEKIGDLDLIVTRKFYAPVPQVFAAWSKPELMQQWWAPHSFGKTLVCAMDVRAGGDYRFEYSKDGAFVMAFFGKYVEVVPDAKLAWTNDESSDGPITTVTFVADGGGTLMTLTEAHKTTAAREESCLGMEGMAPEQFAQLDAFLAS